MMITDLPQLIRRAYKKMIKLIGGIELAAGNGELAATTSAGAAITVDKATMVRVFNGHSGDVLVTVQQADNTLIGTFTLVTKGVEYVKKDSLHEMFAGNAAVKFANVQILG